MSMVPLKTEKNNVNNKKIRVFMSGFHCILYEIRRVIKIYKVTTSRRHTVMKFGRN